MLSATDRERLAKLLGVLGSEHAGERDAAALAIERLPRSTGASWAELAVDHPARPRIITIATAFGPGESEGRRARSTSSGRSEGGHERPENGESEEHEGALGHCLLADLKRAVLRRPWIGVDGYAGPWGRLDLGTRLRDPQRCHVERSVATSRLELL